MRIYIEHFVFQLKTVFIMSGAAKKLTTGLTGLVVARNPHFTLTGLYNKTLKALAQMPEDYAYRKYTEQLIKQRLHVVSTEPDVAKLEEKINCGQVEELIIQAENELNLARKFLKTYKPWEPLVEEAPTNQWRWPL